MGVANDRSIAWAIAKAVHAHGGQVALTYQGEAVEEAASLAQSIGCELILPCDVMDDASLGAVFETLAKGGGGSTSSSTPIAYSDKEQLKGRYVETTGELQHDNADLLLFFYRRLPVRREADVGRRQPADPDLHGQPSG